jgi:hypothetical protein
VWKIKFKIKKIYVVFWFGQRWRWRRRRQQKHNHDYDDDENNVKKILLSYIIVKWYYIVI